MNLPHENEGIDRSQFNKLFILVAICMCFFQVYVALNPIHPWILYVVHLGFGLMLASIHVPRSKKLNKPTITWLFNILLALAAFSSTVYFVLQTESILRRVGIAPTPLDLFFGVILILVILEIARRTIGIALPLIAIVFLLYGRYGGALPGFLGHNGLSWERLISFTVGQEGIFSTPLSTSARFVFLFVLFGSLIQISGAGKFFIDFAIAIAGAMRGGPAKISVIASAFFGSISGASTTNVVTTGAFTIPLMKKIGYRPSYAGAVEATASTGGQIMPPIMGAAAFILAEIVGIPYYQVLLAAIIPALLYFLSVLVMIDLEAGAKGLKGLPRAQLPKLKQLVIKKGYLFSPILVIVVGLLVFNLSATRVALWGILTAVIIILIHTRKIEDLKNIIYGMAEGAKNALGLIAAVACAGIVVGVLSITGTGLRFADAVLFIAGDFLPLALILSMVASMILGMGLPTTAAYLIGAAVVAPALIGLGVDPLAAHLFILYYASLSAITPPVGIAAYAAAGIANANPLSVAFNSVKLGMVAYIIPFMFVYHPSILGDGSLGVIFYSLITAIVGVFCLGFGLQGWFFGKSATILQRILLLSASLAMIVPGIMSDIVGCVLILFTIISRKFCKKTIEEVNYDKVAQ